MRKFVLLVSLMMSFSFALSAQDGVLKTLCKQAMRKGRAPREFYHFENSNGRNFSAQDFNSWCQQNDYIAGGVKYKEINRFGDIAKIVSEGLFLPKSEYIDYLYANLAAPWTSSPASLDAFKAGGSAYVSRGEPISGRYYHPLKDVRWTGEIKDGKIEGRGFGFAFSEDGKTAYVFAGDYHMGYPGVKVEYQHAPVNYSYYQNHGGFTYNSSGFVDDVAFFKLKDKYGFIDARNGQEVAPAYDKVISAFSGDKAEVELDGREIVINRRGVTLGNTAKQQAADDAVAAALKAEQKRQKEEAEAAARKRAEERRIAEQKAAEERRIAEEKQRAYLAQVQKNSDPTQWDLGDRLCLVEGGKYISGTLEEWNSTKTKCKIKIVTSPGARYQYNGENLEKNTTIWIDTKGAGWHKILPEELVIANRTDNSTKVNSIVTAVKCSSCDGHGWFRNGDKCYNCDGTGLVNKTQNF